MYVIAREALRRIRGVHRQEHGLTRQEHGLTRTVTKSLIAIATLCLIVGSAFTVIPSASAGSEPCTGSDTRLCVFKDVAYHHLIARYRCDEVSYLIDGGSYVDQQGYLPPERDISSIRNNCGPHSAFALISQVRLHAQVDGSPQFEGLVVTGQTFLPSLGALNDKLESSSRVRLPDEIARSLPPTTSSPDDLRLSDVSSLVRSNGDRQDGHWCRGSDTRICFFADRDFSGDEKSFRCDDDGRKSLGYLAGKASSVINNCRAGSAFEIQGVGPDGKGRSFVVAGQREYGWLRWHNIDDVATQATRLR